MQAAPLGPARGAHDGFGSLTAREGGGVALSRCAHRFAALPSWPSRMPLYGTTGMAKTGVETAGAAKTGIEGVSLFAKGLRHILADSCICRPLRWHPTATARRTEGTDAGEAPVRRGALSSCPNRLSGDASSESRNRRFCGTIPFNFRAGSGLARAGAPFQQVPAGFGCMSARAGKFPRGRFPGVRKKASFAAMAVCRGELRLLLKNSTCERFSKGEALGLQALYMGTTENSLKNNSQVEFFSRKNHRDDGWQAPAPGRRLRNPRPCLFAPGHA